MQEAAGQFESGEAKILKAALNLKDQNITTIMKKMDEVYMLELGTVINRHILGEIYKKSLQRIPVYQGESEVTNDMSKGNAFRKALKILSQKVSTIGNF